MTKSLGVRVLQFFKARKNKKNHEFLNVITHCEVLNISDTQRRHNYTVATLWRDFSIMMTHLYLLSVISSSQTMTYLLINDNKSMYKYIITYQEKESLLSDSRYNILVYKRNEKEKWQKERYVTFPPDVNYGSK